MLVDEIEAMEKPQVASHVCERVGLVDAVHEQIVGRRFEKWLLDHQRYARMCHGADSVGVHRCRVGDDDEIGLEFDGFVNAVDIGYALARPGIARRT